MVKVNLLEEITLFADLNNEQDLIIWRSRKNILSRENTKCKGPEEGRKLFVILGPLPC